MNLPCTSNFLRNVWQGALPLRDFLDRSLQRAWTAPEADGILDDLPTEFTAVRLYFRDSFPDTPDNRTLVGAVVERLAARRHVVLLNTGVLVDEHVDAEPASGPRVLRPLTGAPPSKNLLVQSAVLSRARLFVGTYGGLAHLAPFYGVPTIGFASDPKEINPVHVAIARRTAVENGTPLAVVNRTGFELLEGLAHRPPSMSS